MHEVYSHTVAHFIYRPQPGVKCGEFSLEGV